MAIEKITALYCRLSRDDELQGDRMAAYMENQEAYIQLFQDAKKYHAVQAALADMLYRDLHDKKS